MTRLDQLIQFHSEDPNDSFVRFALASEYAKLGDDPQARLLFEELVRDDPEYVGTYYHLAKTCERVGDSLAAINVYKAGIVVANKLSDTHARAELQSALLEAEGLGYD